jgi:hypothetical protein
LAWVHLFFWRKNRGFAPDHWPSQPTICSDSSCLTCARTHTSLLGF